MHRQRKWAEEEILRRGGMFIFKSALTPPDGGDGGIVESNYPSGEQPAGRKEKKSERCEPSSPTGIQDEYAVIMKVGCE